MNTLKDIISMGGGLFEEAYNTGRRDALRETGAEDLRATVTALEAANKVLGEKLEKAQARIEELETNTEPQWILCSERLPDEDVEVLISYRDKDGEGNVNHTYIDITTYGQMYFGGNKVGNYKHWRAPFEYFESNYEVIAWMPLPKPYEGERKDNETD